MDLCVGIPRALLFHEYGRLWTDFFRQADVPVTVSDDTNSHILNRGTVLAVDESCLPLKVYLGHVESLLPKCTHIFVPRIVQYHSNFYFCAKFAGLPDIVRNVFGIAANRLIAPNIDGPAAGRQFGTLYPVCKSVGLSYKAGHSAYSRALASWRKPKEQSGGSAGIKIAMLGHSYLLKDAFFCRDVFDTLSLQNVGIVTADDIPEKELYAAAKVFEPDIYWQLSAKLAGAANLFASRSDIAGIIVLSSFGCGPDSLVNEYLEHHVLQKCAKPYIIINLDEHTGRAGIVTRIEAFWDLVKWRSKR